VTPDELPGGSITVELGGLSRDTVELRDGSVVLGDVVSLSMTQVVVRVEGKEQSYDRNQIKKIMLVEREVIIQPSVTQPVPAQPRP
jgi:exosome complex RNA-binding protein Csl4